MTILPHEPDPLLIRGLRAAMSAQRPAVLLHIRGIRRRYPQASPQQVVSILERRYLASITLTGAGSGAATMIPGVGTAIGLTVIGVETVTFFEMTALYAQSVAEIHGIVVEDEERAHNLVMALLLGGPGKDLVQQFVKQATGKGPDRSQYWGETVTASLPKTLTSLLNKRLRDALVRRLTIAQGSSMAGRLIPFGIGAIVGGTGNRLLGGKVVAASRDAFGPAPVTFPAELAEVIRIPKESKKLTAGSGTTAKERVARRLVIRGERLGSAIVPRLRLEPRRAHPLSVDENAADVEADPGIDTSEATKAEPGTGEVEPETETEKG